eukprot:m.430297 g.430297  ORF g.430297 m.430297 type:complete len:83 (-) comp17144_c0_seq1:890-1138(-)
MDQHCDTSLRKFATVAKGSTSNPISTPTSTKSFEFNVVVLAQRGLTDGWTQQVQYTYFLMNDLPLIVLRFLISLSGLARFRI